MSIIGLRIGRNIISVTKKHFLNVRNLEKKPDSICLRNLTERCRIQYNNNVWCRVSDRTYFQNYLPQQPILENANRDDWDRKTLRLAPETRYSYRRAPWSYWNKHNISRRRQIVDQIINLKKYYPCIRILLVSWQNNFYFLQVCKCYVYWHRNGRSVQVAPKSEITIQTSCKCNRLKNTYIILSIIENGCNKISMIGILFLHFVRARLYKHAVRLWSGRP